MHNRKLWGYLLLVGLAVLLTGAHVAHASTSITDTNGWTVTFVSRIYNASNKTTTFTYTVKGTGAQRALSNFVVALPTCSPSFVLLSYSPTRAVTLGLDPKSGLRGIKWDLGVETTSAQTYSFTYRGNIPLGTTQASTKAGTSIALTTLPGAACEWPRGKIVVKKVTVGGDASFTFTPSYGGQFSLSNGQSNTSAPLAPGAYAVSETVPAGWDGTGAACDNGNSPSAIMLEPGQTVTCTFTNTQRGTARVVKTVTNAAATGAPSGGMAFTFDLRQGASAGAAGALIETQVANAANGGSVTFSAQLVPGTYQVCERATTGWQTTLSTPTQFTLPGTTDTLCGDFTVAAGETKTLTVDDADRGLPQCPTTTITNGWVYPPQVTSRSFYLQQRMWDAETGIAAITPLQFTYTPRATGVTVNVPFGNISYNLAPTSAWLALTRPLGPDTTDQATFSGVGPNGQVYVKGWLGLYTDVRNSDFMLRVLVTDYAGNQAECDPLDFAPDSP